MLTSENPVQAWLHGSGSRPEAETILTYLGIKPGDRKAVITQLLRFPYTPNTNSADESRNPALNGFSSEELAPLENFIASLITAIANRE